MGKVFESCIVQIKSVALSNGHWTFVKADYELRSEAISTDTNNA